MKTHKQIDGHIDKDKTTGRKRQEDNKDDKMADEKRNRHAGTKAGRQADRDWHIRISRQPYTYAPLMVAG